MTKSNKTRRGTNCLKERARKKCIGTAGLDRRCLLDSRTTKPPALRFRKVATVSGASGRRLSQDQPRAVDRYEHLEEGIYEQNKRYARNRRRPEQPSNGCCGRSKNR